jgi:hypothetical protein
MADAVAHVKALPIGDADKARVAGGNALAFYKLPASAGVR